MGFLFNMLEAPAPDNHKSASVELMHKLGCRVCPRAANVCRSPDMRPSGAKEPLIYMLGTQPDKEDDEDDQQFSKDSKGGRLLRAYLPDDVSPDIRWNNIVRTYAPGMPRLTNTEIECCRPSVEADIIASRPDAIFGFGVEPLHWVRPGMRLADMRGRRFPVRIGEFVTWYYCFEDPLELRRPQPTKWGGWKVDPQREFIFRFDLKRACGQIEHQGKPRVILNSQALAGIEVIDRKHGGLRRVLEFLDAAGEQNFVGYDYETSALRPYRKDAVILSLGMAWAGTAAAFPIHHREAGWTHDETTSIYGGIRSLLRKPVRKAVHNLAFELEWTGVKFGIEHIRTDTWEDSTSQAFILDERVGTKRRDGPASLQFGCRLHFDLSIKTLSPEIDANSKKDMANVSQATILPYNALDARGHYWYFEEQDKLLTEENMQTAYRMKVDHVKTVVLTQIKGAPIDADENQKLFDLYTTRVNAALDAIEKSPHWATFRDMTNRHFNPGSEDKDLQILLGRIIKTKHGLQEDGKYSTEKEELEKVRDPIIKPILAWRRATKALSTYVLPLRPTSVHNYDGWCHTILNTTVARTGRLSSEDPNVQNYPVRDPEMGKVRAQIAWTTANQHQKMMSHTALNDNERKLIMKVDYGQIEARVIAMVSKDPVFVKALWDRYDVHMAWAIKIEKQVPRILRRWTGDDYPTREKAMKTLRTAVKNEWTFPLFFGAQLKGVAQFLQVQEHELLSLREEFWDTFKGVKRWQEELEREYRETGEVRYITGRKARGPLSPNQLFNYPIQGPTCDIIMDAMKRVSARSVADWNFQPIFQIHDDLTFLLPESKVGDYAEPIIDDMLAVPFDFVNVPITLEVAIGPNWHDVKSEGDFSSDTWKKAA